VAVWLFALRRLEAAGVFGLALMALGLGSSLILMIGRAGFGPEQALASRYSTLSMISVAGLALVVETCASAPIRQLGRGVLFSLLAVALGSSLHNYRPWAAGVRAQRMEAAEHLRSGDPPNQELQRRLFPDVSFLEAHMEFLRQHRYSMFR
jgi:hypothetical protein